DTDIPAATLAEGYISVDTLVVGAGDYTWKGRNYQVNGTGDVLFSGSEETLNTWYVQPQAQITWMGVKDSDHTRKDGTRIETEGD
ncbi:autotransporter outer membrane beta-barrel domain-containing protein, partial [Escherichia coli]|uniref:autotransporter outer membrane beta-barrel domain-containing protein n=1 Tax=Escherichia coli TaxID=562 RepID=UPI00384DDE70